MGENLELQEAGWEELRKEARKVEGDLDVKLSSYAKIGGRFTQGYTDTGSPTIGSSRSWKTMEMEIQSLLEKLLDINDAMSRCAASAAPTTSVTQKLARHRDILHEFTQEFKRTKGNINSMREHAELLSSVRDDISEYKASGSPRIQVLRERAAIHGSITQNIKIIPRIHKKLSRILRALKITVMGFETAVVQAETTISDRRSDQSSSSHKVSVGFTKDFVRRASRESEAIERQVPYNPWPPWQHQKEAFEGHPHPCCCHCSLHLVLDNLLAFKVKTLEVVWLLSSLDQK